MGKDIYETERLETMQDHFELLSEIMGCSSELLDNAGNNPTTTLEKEFVKMISDVTKSLRLKCRFVVKQSARFHRKPSLFQRLRDWREEREEAKERRRMLDADYREWKAQKEAQNEALEEAEAKEDQAGGENSSSLALRKEQSMIVVDEEDSYIEE